MCVFLRPYRPATTRLVVGFVLFLSSSRPNSEHWRPGVIETLGVAPSQQQWEMKVYRDPPTKNIIILVVTVTGRGATPNRNMFFFV